MPIDLNDAIRSIVADEVNRALEPHTATLQRLTSFLGGSAFAGVRRGPGRPPKAGGGGGRSSRGSNAGRACAVMGCGRDAKSKGYCASHYQKLRNLIRTNRRPADWKDNAPADSVKDIVLPRGRAAAKLLAKKRG